MAENDEEYERKIRRFQEIIDESKNMVFFGGAGVSTESGIPDFRSQDGLYSEEYAYPPETIISHGFFLAHTAEFYRFYKKKISLRLAQCLSSGARALGRAGKIKGGRHAEHRRAPPKSGEQKRVRTARQRLAQFLYAL